MSMHLKAIFRSFSWKVYIGFSCSTLTKKCDFSPYMSSVQATL